MVLANHTSRCCKCHNIRPDIEEGLKTCNRCREWKKIYAKTKKGKESYNRSKAKWRKTVHGTELMMAHAYVGVALKRGKLHRQPCAKCNVTWLCKEHHRSLHNELG